MGMLLSLFLLLVPVIYEKYDKFPTLARALKEDRVAFILTGTGSVASLLIAYVQLTRFPDSCLVHLANASIKFHRDDIGMDRAWM
jgi:hypothetical protein